MQMKSKSILHLTLTRSPFDRIVLGKKTTEFRERKPYWETRLRNRHYDEVHFRNGYSKGVPFMRIECLGIVDNIFVADPPYYPDWRNNYMGHCFGIRLGAILELKDWQCPKSPQPQSAPT